jgi:tRNA A37 threonylcarbamoyltransferase TsaD
MLAERLPIDITYTDRKLCTDNGAMIATLGCFTALHGRPTADPYTLDINPNLSM